MKPDFVHKGKSLTSFILSIVSDTLVRLTKLGVYPSDRQQVLLVRPDGIGDFILWLDAVRAIPFIFPPERYRIVLIANSVWAPLAEDAELFDEVIPLNRHLFLHDIHYRFRMARRIRKMGFAVAFQPVFSREALVGDAIIRICGAPVTIGLDGDCINTSNWVKRFTDQWYSRLIPTGGPAEMELIRNAQAVRHLGYHQFLASFPRIKPTLRSTTLSPTPYYVLQPGAGLGLKRWPTDRFAALATKIYQETGMEGFVCGGDNDTELSDAICQATPARLRTRCGSTTIHELVDLIANAVFVVGNDTGAMHIAAATKTPGVCILGEGEKSRFFPYCSEMGDTSEVLKIISHPFSCAGCGWFCHYPIGPGMAAPCVADITIDEVWVALQELISKILNSHSPEAGRC